MNRVQDFRWEQLRAVEADLLSPPPEDPFQCFPSGWIRAATLTDDDWVRRLMEVVPAAPPADRPSSRQRIRRTPPPPINNLHNHPRVHRVLPMRQVNGGRRAQRAANNAQLAVVPVPAAAVQPRPQPIMAPAPVQVQNNNENRVPEAPEPSRRRPLSPTQLPGVRAIPKNYNHFFRGLLTPGDYFAKSQTRYLGPFEEMPTEDSLPRHDDYIILQRMGRLPESGKSIFRQVGTVSN